MHSSAIKKKEFFARKRKSSADVPSFCIGIGKGPTSIVQLYTKPI